MGIVITRPIYRGSNFAHRSWTSNAETHLVLVYTRQSFRYEDMKNWYYIHTCGVLVASFLTSIKELSDSYMPKTKWLKRRHMYRKWLNKIVLLILIRKITKNLGSTQRIF